jgi:hypothetical protein
VFHEEQTQPFTCLGALAFGILSDGTYTLCCQDVEGQMDIGNIATMDLRTAFESPRREEIIANCATSRVCRRCAGNTMILDTQPVREEWQTIDKFGFGWHIFEKYLGGIGGRWTAGNAKSYFYTRLQSMVLELQFQSPFPSDTKFQLLLSAYDPATKLFSLEQSAEFRGRQEQLARVNLPVNLRKSTFYRLTILSPTFCPKEIYGSEDTRRLGLAIISLRLGGRPYEDLSEQDKVATLMAAPPAVSSASAYTFPILS